MRIFFTRSHLKKKYNSILNLLLPMNFDYVHSSIIKLSLIDEFEKAWATVRGREEEGIRSSGNLRLPTYRIKREQKNRTGQSGELHQASNAHFDISQLLIILDFSR